MKTIEATNDNLIRELLANPDYRVFPDGRIEKRKKNRRGSSIIDIWISVIHLRPIGVKQYYTVYYRVKELNKSKPLRTGRIIWAAFNTDGENGTRAELDRFKIIRHLNDDGLDDRIENLKLGTHSENMFDAFRNGINTPPPPPEAKYSNEIAEAIKNDRDVNKLTYRQISEKYNIPHGSIGDFISRRRWSSPEEKEVVRLKKTRKAEERAEIERKIIEEYPSSTFRALGEKYNMSPGTVFQIVKKLQQ